MKNIAFILFFSLFQLTVNAQHVTKTEQGALKPQFEFVEEVIDYGTIAKDADGHRVFKFKNVGSAPLVIENVKGSCGCTVPTKPEEPVMPGEFGEIKVKYATNRVGRFSKSVTITSNATEKPKVVRIKGEVLAK